MNRARAVGRGQIITGVVMLVVGLVLAAVGVVGLIFAGALFVTSYSAPESTPATFTRSLDGGTTYVVFELTESGTGSTVSPDDVTVTGPGGPVAVAPLDSDQTYTTGGDGFHGVVSFDPPQSGTYQIAVDTPDATVLVGPSSTSVGKFVPWIVALLLGILLFLAGIVLLIIGLVRRSSRRRAVAAPVSAPVSSAPAQPAVAQTAPPAAAQTAPPGWYPDPTQPGSRRYWDGASWTEHRA